MATTKFLGTTDDVTTCDCCGRTNLKNTVALSIDDADPVYFGVTCAAHALKTSAKEVRAESKRADDENAKTLAAARKAKQDADFRLWTSYLDNRVPHLKGDVFRQIESLGGYVLARSGYDSLMARPDSWLAKEAA